jgi:hypothetical protein
MAQVRNVVSHVSVEVAKAKRICYRNRKDHVIVKGERCLVIQERSGQGSKNYCAECAQHILHAARTHLDVINGNLTA